MAAASCTGRRSHGFTLRRKDRSPLLTREISTGNSDPRRRGASSNEEPKIGLTVERKYPVRSTRDSGYKGKSNSPPLWSLRPPRPFGGVRRVQGLALALVGTKKERSGSQPCINNSTIILSRVKISDLLYLAVSKFPYEYGYLTIAKRLSSWYWDVVMWWGLVMCRGYGWVIVRQQVLFVTTE